MVFIKVEISKLARIFNKAGKILRVSFIKTFFKDDPRLKEDWRCKVEDSAIWNWKKDVIKLRNNKKNGT